MLIPRVSCVMGTQFLEHPLNGAEIDPRFSIFRATRVFFAQDARPTQPGEGSLNHPAARQHHERMLIRQCAHDLHGHPIVPFDRADDAGGATINPEFRDRGTPSRQDGQHILGTITVTAIRCLDDHGQEIALRINRDVAFAPGPLCPPHRSRVRRPIPWFWWIDCRDSQRLARQPGQWPGGPADGSHR